MYLSYLKVYLYFYWASDCTTRRESSGLCARMHTLSTDTNMYRINFHDQMVSINNPFVSGYSTHVNGITVIVEREKKKHLYRPNMVAGINCKRTHIHKHIRNCACTAFFEISFYLNSQATKYK